MSLVRCGPGLGDLRPTTVRGGHVDDGALVLSPEPRPGSPTRVTGTSIESRCGAAPGARRSLRGLRATEGRTSTSSRRPGGPRAGRAPDARARARATSQGTGVRAAHEARTGDGDLEEDTAVLS